MLSIAQRAGVTFQQAAEPQAFTHPKLQPAASHHASLGTNAKSDKSSFSGFNTVLTPLTCKYTCSVGLQGRPSSATYVACCNGLPAACHLYRRDTVASLYGTAVGFVLLHGGCLSSGAAHLRGPVAQMPRLKRRCWHACVRI